MFQKMFQNVPKGEICFPKLTSSLFMPKSSQNYYYTLIFFLCKSSIIVVIIASELWLMLEADAYYEILFCLFSPVQSRVESIVQPLNVAACRRPVQAGWADTEGENYYLHSRAG